ncbi:MAG: DUF3180 domain-containing protein [Nocardioidaceae bacterium]
MAATRLSSLAAVFVVAGLLGFASVQLWESRSRSAPRIEWPAVTALALVAVVLLAFAYSTYGAVHRDRTRIDPQRAVSLLLLAKASALVGAVVAGGYLGFGINFLGRLDVELPRERAIRALVAAVMGLAIVFSALLLERACRVPQDSND